MTTIKETVLSGIRATGRLHFGNLMGAVRHFVDFQKPENRCLYFVADLHTLTTLRNPGELRGNVIEIVKDYLAAGLNPDAGSIIYVQSSVPEISELSLLLSMIQSLGELERIPTYKDLLRKNSDNVTLGLITYPVLMAADILGPKATLVPVGEDQVPNVELARNLAHRFNTRFEEEVFVIPKMMGEMTRIPGLDGEKMGKSEADNAININAPMSEIRQRYLNQGVTDPERKRMKDPGDPYRRCKSVYPLHSLITPGEAETRTIAIACQTAQIGCVECKNRLVDSLTTILEPFQERRAALANRNDDAREVLHEGGKNARRIIAETVAKVRDKMGIIVY